MRPWTIAALATAAVSVVVPPVALAAVVVLVFALLFVDRQGRWLLALIAAPLAVFGLYRFAVNWMMPNLVSAGQRSAEERAVSRLREILWAEERVRELGFCDSDGDGQHEFALLPELVGAAKRATTNARAAVLKPDLYRVVRPVPAVFQSEGYLFAVYLFAPDGAPSASAPTDLVDGKRAARQFIAYAWPLELDQNGRRVFVIDQDDHVCETVNPRGYAGLASPPAPDAAPLAAGFATCGQGGDGDAWRRWRKLGR